MIDSNDIKEVGKKTQHPNQTIPVNSAEISFVFVTKSLVHLTTAVEKWDLLLNITRGIQGRFGEDFLFRVDERLWQTLHEVTPQSSITFNKNNIIL